MVKDSRIKTQEIFIRFYKITEKYLLKKYKPELAFSTITEINEVVCTFLDKSEVTRDLDLAASEASLSTS